MRLSGGSRMCVWVLVARFCARNSARAVRFVHLGRDGEEVALPHKECKSYFRLYNRYHNN